MGFINKRWAARKLWLWGGLAIVFIILICGCLVWNVMWHINVRNEILNEYMPVRLDPVLPAGQVYDDGSASMVFGIINHSNHKQAVTFLMYQHNISTGEDQLFNIKQVIVFLDNDAEQEIENGIVNIDPGKEVTLLIRATARDSTKVMPSRAAPDVEIVTLEQ